MTLLRVITPLANLRISPEGGLDSQLLYGEEFTVAHTENARSYGSTACGYSGWVKSNLLALVDPPTHRVCALATYIHQKPELKSAATLRLLYGAKVVVTATMGDYCAVNGGYIYTRHLTRRDAPDFVTEAERFAGTPYLWGGRSAEGIDCSGLVQLSLGACGIIVPRDSGPQQTSIGRALPNGPSLQRGDLVFWKGHVGIMTNETKLLHANAHHMCVTHEPLDSVCTRIKAAGDGDILMTRRILDIE